MFDLSWGEMGLIALVALIVIGPKELPQVLRTVRSWLGAARGMAREFQTHVDDMMRDSGIDEVRKSIRDNTALHLDDLADQVDPDRKIRDAVDPKSYDPNLLLGDAPATPATPTAEEFKSGGEFHPPAEEAASALPAASEPTLADVAPPPSFDVPTKSPA
ncbi:MAG: Sec-independent protein translocase protein TatB [Reyranellaceae bacterium]